MRKRLGLNIDHVATLREARKSLYPDPVEAAVLAELAGVDSITVHLREDRRHIQDRDVVLLRKLIKTRLNLEMALNPGIIDTALEIVPDDVCIVPEKREEITTEGGLDAVKYKKNLLEAIPRLHEKGIIVSLFIDPGKAQIEASREAGADYIEIHTGKYAEAKGIKAVNAELSQVIESARFAFSIGLKVNAGHGLNYANVYPVALIEEIETLNIGHSIISRAVMTGLEKAVESMLSILEKAHTESQHKGSLSDSSPV